LLIRKVRASDLQSIVSINAREEEKTSPIDLARITQLNSWSTYHRVAVKEDQVVGFLLVMSNASGYDGANFRWFVDRYSNFLYVDRIVIDPVYAGTGVGTALYGDLIDFARGQGHVALCCEINVLPPNPISHAFHARFGFREVGLSNEVDAQKVVSFQIAVL
jgi:predicted GNAT superfamily acetyltransferase